MTTPPKPLNSATNWDQTLKRGGLSYGESPSTTLGFYIFFQQPIKLISQSNKIIERSEEMEAQGLCREPLQPDTPCRSTPQELCLRFVINKEPELNSCRVQAQGGCPDLSIVLSGLRCVLYCLASAKINTHWCPQGEIYHQFT